MSQPSKTIQNSLASKIMDEELEIVNEQITKSSLLELIQLVQSNHPSLKTLKLNNCLFTTEIGKHGNSIHKPINITPLLHALQENTVVSTLNLDHNNETGDGEVSDQNAKAISELLRLNQTITALSLNSCDITPKRMQLIAEGLNGNTSLKTLILANNPIESTGAAALESALANNRVLTSLDLTSTRLYATGGAQIAILIKRNLFLKTLILIHNSLDLGNECDIAAALKFARENTAMASTMTTLSKTMASTSLGNTRKMHTTYESPEPTGLNTIMLGNNNLPMVTLTPAIRSYSSIRILDVSNNAIKDIGAKAIADNLLAPKLINSLNLRQCEIGLKGMQAISKALSKNEKDQKVKAESLTDIVKPASAASEPLEESAESKDQTELEILDLSQNNHDNQSFEFAKELAMVLSVNRSLKTLHFNHNGIGTSGTAELARALKFNTGLETLSLDGNGIGNLGYLTSALTPTVSTSNQPLIYNKTLTSLSLMGNTLASASIPGGEDFCNMFSFNTSLKIVDLGAMYFQGHDGETWALNISQGLQNNQTLERLRIGIMGINLKGAEAILNAVAINKYRALTNLDFGGPYTDNLINNRITQGKALCQRNRTYRLTWGYISPIMAFGKANYGHILGSNGAALIPFLPQFRKLMGAKERDESPTFKDKQNLGRFITTAYYQSVIKGPQSPALQTQNMNNKASTAAAVATNATANSVATSASTASIAATATTLPSANSKPSSF